jgi:hypothetical protein
VKAEVFYFNYKVFMENPIKKYEFGEINRTRVINAIEEFLRLNGINTDETYVKLENQEAGIIVTKASSEEEGIMSISKMIKFMFRFLADPVSESEFETPLKLIAKACSQHGKVIEIEQLKTILFQAILM